MYDLEKYNKIKEKLNDLEEIDFTAAEYHLIFEMAEIGRAHV